MGARTRGGGEASIGDPAGLTGLTSVAAAVGDPALPAAFDALFRFDVDAYDPWDASHRTDTAPYPGSTMCSAFRTFQGWTALSEMRNDQGVLHTVPIPEVFAYLLLWPLCSDVPDDDMCGVWTTQVFPVGTTGCSTPCRPFPTSPRATRCGGTAT